MLDNIKSISREVKIGDVKLPRIIRMNESLWIVPKNEFGEKVSIRGNLLYIVGVGSGGIITVSKNVMVEDMGCYHDFVIERIKKK